MVLLGVAAILLTTSIGIFFGREKKQTLSSGEEVRSVSESDWLSNFSNEEELSKQNVADASRIEHEPVRILFGGDMMFDRYIREKAGDDRSRVFAGVRSVLRSADVVVANLEGPVTSNPSKSIGSAFGSRENYVFTFDPAWAKTLFEENIRIVNIGNNHILNFGVEGVVETREALRSANVTFFGDPLDKAFGTHVLSVKEMRIGFVNYNQFVEGGEEKALADIARIRPAVDVLFVYTHWGAEYMPATSEEKRLAHAFIDRGANAVIGSHPHVVQEQEVYQGKTIYYSLGNFVFDQYFRPDTKQGLLVRATIYPDRSISFEETSILMKPDGTTVLE